MEINTIIVDLDKTLLRTDKTISSYTAEIFKKCAEKGIRIMVATARPLRTTIGYCDIIHFDAMTVSNGARIICKDQRKEYGICKKSAIQVLKALNKYPNFRITLETGDIAYSNKPIDEYETVVCDDLAEVAKNENVLKLLIGLDSQDTLDTVKKELTEDLYYTVAHGYLMQIMDRSATKWNGIKSMLDIVGLSPDKVAYFGDDQDDIEPIKFCGIGIAVSNGIDEAKAVADHIAGSNDEDGVARFIEKMFLSREK